MISCQCFPGSMSSFPAEEDGQSKVFVREMIILADPLIDQSKQSICSYLLVETVTAQGQFPAEELPLELQPLVLLVL